MKKPIKGYEGLYEVDSLGNVFSLERSVARSGTDKAGQPSPPLGVKGKQLKNYQSKTGYYVVNLRRDAISKQRYVHDLVAETFLGERPTRATINHKDGDKLNNNVSNLEYCTYAENNEHARRTGLSNHNIKDFTLRRPVAMLTMEGEFIKSFPSAMEAKSETGAWHISCVCKGSRPTSGGYKWKYHEKN